MVLHARVSHTARWVEERATKLLTVCVHILPVLGALGAWSVSTSDVCGCVLSVVRSISTVDAIASG